MSLKVDKRQIPLILGLVAVIAAVLVYFFVYQKYQEKTAAIEGANSKLQGQLDELNSKVSSKQFYETEVERMEAGIQKAYGCFPPAIEEEDALMEAMRLEALAPMHVTTTDFAEPVSLYMVGTGQLDGNQAAPVPEDAVPAETTLEEDVAAAQAGQTTNYGELQVPDLNFSSGALPAGYQGEYGPITLNLNVLNLNFVTSYDGLKRTLNYLNTNPDRRTINNIALAYNEDTGLLSVAAVINEYSLTGTGKTYEYPFMPMVSQGTPNIFGSADFSEGMDLEYILKGGERTEDEGGEAQEGQENAEEAAPAAGQ